MRSPISTPAVLTALAAATIAWLPADAGTHDVAVPGAVLLQGSLSAAGQTSSQIERNVRDSLGRDSELRQLDVSVEGSQVTLTGRLRTFWAKKQAITLALAVPGVETVVSEMEIPVQEDDEALAVDVAQAVLGYPYYTMWDQVDGRINKGVVSLSGRVTPDQNKANDIFERVARVRGVQDVQSEIRTLPPSPGDAQLRQAIANQVFTSMHFEQFGSMQNPPFHIIVETGIVTLVGHVRSDIERIEMQRIVAQTPGVLRVDNQLKTDG